MKPDTFVYHPLFFNLDDPLQYDAFKALIADGSGIEVVDHIVPQIEELLRVSFPSETVGKEALAYKVNDFLKDLDTDRYGVWVYYPWLRKVVHLLNQNDFALVRTSRNKYKISAEEIEVLSKKKVGIIGLSVGQSIALTMALERTCGEIRLADFDTVELSNMNRLRCSVCDMGVNKAVLAARQIAELDPFIHVICYPEGVTTENMDDFMLKEGKLDVLVEECDGIDVKILARVKARKYRIPVVMDTNDRGMLDIERFDREPERPLMHGRLQSIASLNEEELAQRLMKLSFPEKVAFLTEMIGVENVSPAMLQSLQEMNKTIVGWPQVASAVTLGGAMVTDVTRRILLGKLLVSGRYFVEFEDLICDDPNKNVYSPR